MAIVVQCDDRDLNYIQLTKKINQLACSQAGLEYSFIDLKQQKVLCQKTGCAFVDKLFIISEFINRSSEDVLVFLDTDAWIQTPFSLIRLIEYLKKNTSKHGCFSRDPYLMKNTFINSGSFIIKINDYTKKMYQLLLENYKYTKANPHLFYHEKEKRYMNPFFWQDQFYTSNYVLNHLDDFFVFVPHLLNTPFGYVLRHNWRKTKNKKMMQDLNHILKYGFSDQDQDFNDFIDKEPFPNPNKIGFDYPCASKNIWQLALKRFFRLPTVH